MSSGAAIHLAGYGQHDDGNTVFSAVRLHPSGLLDHGFGRNGSAMIPVGDATACVHGMAVDGGRIYLAGEHGSASDGRWEYAAVRLMPDGTLDERFGDGGKVRFSLGNRIDRACAIAIDRGRIYLAGSSHGDAGDHFSIACLKEDGSLDGSFGQEGKTILALGTRSGARAVAVHKGGIYVAGHAFQNKRCCFAVARLHPDGELDEGFGRGGQVLLRVGDADATLSAMVVAEGRIYLAGSALDARRRKSRIAAVKLDERGGLDATFGAEGTAILPARGQVDGANAIAVHEGRVLLGGVSRKPRKQFEFTAARLRPEGTPDDTFGDHGQVVIPMGGGGDHARAIAVDGGKIYLAGYSHNGIENDFAVVRLEHDGSLDRGFGVNGGKVWVPVGDLGPNASYDSFATAMTVAE